MSLVETRPDTKAAGFPFREWMEQLKTYADTLGPDARDYVSSTSGWRDYYDDQFTPKEALDEDASYWE